MACRVRNRAGSEGARLVSTVLILLFALLWPAATGAQSPEPGVRLVTPSAVETTLGEVVEVQLRVDAQRPDDLVLELPTLEEGLVLHEAPVFVRRGFEQVEARLRVRATRPGRYLLNGLGVRRGTETEYVEAILIEVRDQEGGIPFALRWRVLVEDTWVGQSIPVVLEMVRIDEFAYPDSIVVRAPEQGLFEEVSGLGSVRSEVYGGVELFEVPVAGFLFTPSQVGEVEIPAAEVGALGYTIRCEPGLIVTNDIPSAAASTVAVGEFSFTVETSTQRLEPAQSGRVTMTVTGRGNLPVLAFPEIEANGLTIIEESEEATVDVDTVGLLGYRGERTRTIRFEADGSTATSSIVVGAFPFFDPRTGQISRIRGRTIGIETPIEETAASDVPTPTYDLIEIGELGKLRWYPLSSLRWVFWGLLVPPFGLGIALVARALRSGRSSGTVGAVVLFVPLFLGLRMTPELDVERLARAHELAAQSLPAVAGVLYDFEIAEHPGNAALHYNRGILALRSQDAARAVFHMRRAVRLVPESELFRSALEETRRYFDLPDDFPIPRYPRPAGVLLAFFGIWALFFVVLFLRGKEWRAIALLSLFLLLVVTAGGFVWSLRVNRTPEATVLQEVTVRRIPVPEASPWVQLEPATIVMVELGYEEFYLIRTGTGVTGWVPVSAVEFSVKREVMR